MDSNALEKERGITISSKYTSYLYGKYTLNAVDTPGHADFGGEVERYAPSADVIFAGSVLQKDSFHSDAQCLANAKTSAAQAQRLNAGCRILGMVDGAVLLVDANEGPLQQTKFVVEKALKAGIRPLVVLNKVQHLTDSHRLSCHPNPSAVLPMPTVCRFNGVWATVYGSIGDVCVQVDRQGATQERCGEVESNIFDLFAQMGATEEQLDFQVLYASAREVPVLSARSITCILLGAFPPLQTTNSESS